MVHWLVQLVTQQVASRHRHEEFTAYAVIIVSAFYPPTNWENSSLCIPYLPHAFAVLDNCRTESDFYKEAEYYRALLG